MKKITLLKTMFMLVVMFLWGSQVSAQLLVENFEYASGDLLTNNGWTAHSGAGTQSVDVVVPGLSFDGYAGSNVGGAANIDNTGEDVHKTFTAQTEGTVYVAALVQVNANTSAGYFLHLGKSTIGTTYFTRVFVNESGDGINVSTSSTPSSYFPITAGTPFLIVLKHDFASSTTNMYILNDYAEVEPTTPVVSIAESLTEIGSIALRQYNSAQRIIVDGIRVANTWAEAVAPTADVPKVSAPFFDVDGEQKSVDTYWNGATVTIGTSTPDATVYYTTNGDVPTTSSSTYSTPVQITTTTTFKALAVKASMDNSDVIEKTITIVAPATAALPYEELFDGSLGDWYAKSIEGDQAWVASSYSSGDYTKFAKISGYSGGNKANQDWLISPQVSTTADGYKLTFASALGYSGPALALKYSTDYDGIADPTTATWTDITTAAAWPDGTTNFAWAESGDVIVEATAPVRFAFVYTSTTEGAATWEVANVKVAEYTVPVVPTITVSDVTVPQLTAMTGETDTETFKVSGVNLTGNITLALSGEGAAQFAVSTNAIEPVAGVVGDTDVTVTFSPTTDGTFAAALTISSAGAANVVLNLEGVATAPPTQLTPADIIISEVYGGGGNSGAELKNDFIELYNTKDVSISLAGWSLQYYSATGTTASASNVFVIPEGKFIPAKGYFLVLASAGSGGTIDIEKPDAVSTLALAGSAGKVVLYTAAEAQEVVVDDITSITGNAAFKDYVPFGTTAKPVWGSAMSTNLTSTTSATRLMVNEKYSYTQNIGYDFGVAAPTPQNSGLTAVAPQPTARVIYVSNGMLHFDAVAGESVEVYNSLGQKVLSSIAQDGLNSLSVAARGVVIVKIADQITKVIL